jgi:dipeptidyl aminopeptidase/acylaminoacyl peptidase
VKPSNILLTENGKPMLSDFGIAKILEGEDAATLTGTGVGMGTPEYMAPEQWVGHAGRQSDIYSLGVVLYELVTGRKPYMADTPPAIMLKQATESLPRPRKFIPDLPDMVEKVLLKALAIKPENRYLGMGPLVNALESLLGGATKTVPTLTDVGPVSTGISQSTVLQGSGLATRQEAKTLDAWGVAPERTVRTQTAGATYPKKSRRPAWVGWLAGIGVGLIGVCVISAIVFGLLYLNGQKTGIGTTPESTLPGSTSPVSTSPPDTGSPFPVFTIGTNTLVVPTSTSTVPTAVEAPILLAYVVGSSYEYENADIYVVNENGSGQTCVACNSCSETEPSISPDGGLVVFQSTCPGHPDLYIVSSNGSGSRALTNTSTLAEREPAFSPDGSQIVYQVSPVTQDRNQNGEIYVMNTDGSGSRSLGIQGRGPAWSPDGSQIAYMSNVSGAWQIYVYDLDTLQSRQITRCSVNCRWPTWSPDGQYIAYNTTLSASSSDPDAVWYIRSDGSGSATLVVDVDGGAGRGELPGRGTDRGGGARDGHAVPVDAVIADVGGLAPGCIADDDTSGMAVHGNGLPVFQLLRGSVQHDGRDAHFARDHGSV